MSDVSDEEIRDAAARELYAALVLGTRDYCAKNGFSDVVIGLSGGIDSTIVACIAVDALGSEHVHGGGCPGHRPAARPQPAPWSPAPRLSERRRAAATWFAAGCGGGDLRDLSGAWRTRR